jgi:hypothetical protein
MVAVIFYHALVSSLTGSSNGPATWRVAMDVNHGRCSCARDGDLVHGLNRTMMVSRFKESLEGRTEHL